MICPKCHIYIDEYGRCDCNSKIAGHHNKAILIMCAVVVAVLFSLPAKAMCYGGNGSDCHGVDGTGSGNLYMPTVRQDLGRDWFTDSELTDAMQALGLDPAIYDQFVGCTLDETADVPNGVLRYTQCTLLANADTSQNLALIFWFDVERAQVVWSYATAIMGEGGE